MDKTVVAQYFKTYHITSLLGRYITRQDIIPIVNQISEHEGVVLETLGVSENGAPIEMITLGTGPKKLLFWSQMHGNESTTTKAILDSIFMLVDATNEVSNTVLNACTLYIVPMLNPDGAQQYTRVNHNAVDLNRDAQELTQSESIILNTLVRRIQPDYAFNLHGQRTIFSAGTTHHSATVSFLAPAGDTERSITPTRKIAMDIIAQMNRMLQEVIPNQVGRYDDGFNINCVGDTLTTLGIPTLLFEAGHYANDYDREVTRMYIFYALLTALYYIATDTITGDQYRDYFLIPENDTCFYDIIIRDVFLANKNVDIAIQYTESLHNSTVNFIPKIAKIGNLDAFFGHKEFIGKKRKITNKGDIINIQLGNEMLHFALDNEVFSTEYVKN